MAFQVASGIVRGREHVVFDTNCQDSVNVTSFEHQNFTYHVGIVTDGCGEGRRSETGAHLASSFLITRIEELIRGGTRVKVLPQILFENLIGFLDQIVTNYRTDNIPEQRVIGFIKDHLLFTVLGFVIGPKTSIIFALGDGVVLQNDLVDIRDQANRPTYPAYHLINKKHLKKSPTPLPTEFDTYVLPTRKLKRLAVATDAWEEELMLLLSLWGKKGNKTSLQRNMNVLSHKEKRFKDDATIVIVEKKDE